MARPYCDEPEHINPYRSAEKAPDLPSPLIAVVGALVIGVCVATYSYFRT